MDHIPLMARFNGWVNGRLYDSVAGLADDALPGRASQPPQRALSRSNDELDLLFRAFEEHDKTRG